VALRQRDYRPSDLSLSLSLCVETRKGGGVHAKCPLFYTREGRVRGVELRMSFHVSETFSVLFSHTSSHLQEPICSFLSQYSTEIQAKDAATSAHHST
jgi:hypothetical protein